MGRESAIRKIGNPFQQPAKGPSGTPFSASASAGNFADDGTPSIRQVAQPQLPIAPPPLWLAAVFQDIQREYINIFGSTSPEECVARLAWLQKIVSAGKEVAAQISQRKSDLTTCDSITLSIKYLISNISLGLDVYRKIPNLHNARVLRIESLIYSKLDDLDKIPQARDGVAKTQNYQTNRLSTQYSDEPT